MKHRLWISLLAALTLLAAALFTGSGVFLSLGVLLLLLLLTGLISVTAACRTMKTEALLSGGRVRRGEDITLEVRVSHRSPLPIAPVTLTLMSLPDQPAAAMQLKEFKGRSQVLTLPFHAAHVGACDAGIESIEVEDLLGFFHKTLHPSDSKQSLLVLPVPFDVEELRFSPGDPGNEAMARATEDISSPSDVRSYQPGDPMKKIHWKLSLRKNELMVRRFEEPVLSEALVLMDCSQPPAWGHPEAAADIRDGLLETAVSLAARLIREEHGVRLPLMGKHPVECTREMGLATLTENLARHDFSESDRFERVLMLETRRLRTVGSVAVIAARLNGAMVDMMISMRRMGPCVRFFLVTFDPEDERIAPMASRLQQGEVEVRFIRPTRK